MRTLFSLSAILLAAFAMGQNKLQFETMSHDFGEIQEMAGPVEFTFNFTNNGEEPIKITHVKASCGCTTPGWTKEEVMPGETGFVMARYNPRNRPGRFRKSLRITASDPSVNRILYISGIVKPKPKTPEEAFPVQVGDFRIKQRALNFGKITTEKLVTKMFDVLNYSDTVSSLDAEAMVLPAHVQIEMVGEPLNPRQVGQLKVTYDPIKKNDYGFVSDQIQLTENDGEQPLSVMAVIEEFFPEMTAEELDASAKLQISDRSFDFGKVTAGTTVEMSFELTNAGNDKLLFRAIKSNCGCVTYDIKKNNIKKGKSQTLNVSFDTSDMRGNQYKSVTIYSNDPTAPTQIITIRGSVAEEKED